jgi:hypothetical protein
MSFYGFNKELGNWRGNAGIGNDILAPVGQPLAIVVLAAGVVAVMITVRRRLTSQDLPVPIGDELRTLARRQWLPIGVILLMALLAIWRAFTSSAEPLVPTVVSNVVMVVLALWLIQVGLRDDRGLPFGAGVLYFLLWTILRYIDLFGDFGGMLGAAMMFFLCGGTLFGVAWYWRHRKETKVESAEPETQAEVTHAV